MAWILRRKSLSSDNTPLTEYHIGYDGSLTTYKLQPFAVRRGEADDVAHLAQRFATREHALNALAGDERLKGFEAVEMLAF